MGEESEEREETANHDNDQQCVRQGLPLSDGAAMKATTRERRKKEKEKEEKREDEEERRGRR